MKINVFMQAPYVIIPLKLIGRKDHVGCWFINLGKLSFFTNEILFSKQCKAEEKAYENYLLRLEEMKVNYYSSLDYVEDLSTNKFKEKKFLPLVKDIDININFKKLNSSFSNVLKDKPEIQLDLRLNKVDLSLNDMLFSELLFLQMHFSKYAQTEASKKNSKEKILQNAMMKGKILKKRTLYQGWTEYFAILSKGNLYIFETPDDLKCKTSFPIYNSILSQSKENPFYFSVIFYSNLNKIF